MARAPVTHVAKLTRVRSLPQDGSRTLNFTTPHLPGRKNGRCPLTFIEPENVPAFEGESAWFLVERVGARPWPRWRALHQVDPLPHLKG